MGEEILWSKTMPGIGVPHRIELVRTPILPSAEQTTAAFVLVVDRSDRVLVTFVDLPGRGWDIPGGHREPGESTREAAVRELAEETGFALAEDTLSVLGWTRISLDERPSDWRYPFPVGFMVFFLARIDDDAPPVAPPPGTECTAAAWMTVAEVQSQCVDPDWLPLIARRTRCPRGPA